MKKWVCFLVAGVLLMGMTACGKTPDASVDGTPAQGTTTTSAQDTTTTTAAQNKTTTTAQNKTNTSAQATTTTSAQNTTTTTMHVPSMDKMPTHFAALLENQQKFRVASYAGDKNPPAYVLSSYLAKRRDSIQSYAILDMDEDGEQELILRLAAEEDKLIITKDGDSYFGFFFSLRGMYRINTDGTFNWNTNAGKTYGCSKLQFTGSDYEEIELWRVETAEDDSVVYYVNEEIVSEALFKSAAVQSDEIEWVS